MEAVAERDSVPIVHWETGRFLATHCRALDPNVLEVGTAIGYSTLHLAEPLLSERAVLVIDNLLVGGEVALPDGAEGGRSVESVASARALNPELLGSQRWLGSVLPIGDGVGFAARL